MSNPVIHSVHIYDESASLIKRLCGIVSSGLQAGNAVLIVATKEHRERLCKELADAATNVQQETQAGRLAMFDAEKILGTFMLGGKPDRALFIQSIGTLLEAARKKARSKDAGLIVFGEMVGVLWEQGNKQGALELEQLWSDTLNSRAFHLHCAYPRSTFMKTGDEAGLAEVCRAHSQVMVQ